MSGKEHREGQRTSMREAELQAKVKELEGCLETERALYEAAKAEFKEALEKLRAEHIEEEKAWSAEMREMQNQLNAAAAEAGHDLGGEPNFA